MRKNKMMRAASGLLVATLLTTSVISGTFAKYTTSGKADDTARVAKWGVTVIANGGTFAKKYDTDENATVVSSTEEKVVAPGTKGELANATITGTPEVAVHVDYTPTLTLTGWTDKDGKEYCPIVIKVGDTSYGLNGMKDADGNVVANGSANMAALKTAVETAIAAYSQDYAAGTDLSTIGTAGYVHVSWNWAFDNGTDVKDTYLGDQAAENNASTIKLEITTTVTQID